MARLRTLGALVVVAVVLAGCRPGGEAALTTRVPAGAGSAAKGPVPTVAGATEGPGLGPAAAACELLSGDVVARAVGNPVRAATGQGKFCFWGTQVDKGTSADLTVTRVGTAGADAACATARSSLAKEAKQEPVSGVGTSAIWSWQQVAILLQGSLVACWPEAVVVVSLTGERDQAVLRAQAASLAQTVHTRF